MSNGRQDDKAARGLKSFLTLSNNAHLQIRCSTDSMSFIVLPADVVANIKTATTGIDGRGFAEVGLMPEQLDV